MSRDDKTKLVNEAVELKDGKYYLSTAWQQTVTNLQSHTRTTTGEEKATGYPKCVMTAKLGSELASQQALESGEVQKVTENGKVYYMFSTISISRKTEAQSRVEVADRREATPEAVQAMGSFVENFNPVTMGALHADYLSGQW